MAKEKKVTEKKSVQKVNEARASIMVAFANSSLPEGEIKSYIQDITSDWFRYRRKLGIEPFGVE